MVDHSGIARHRLAEQMQVLGPEAPTLIPDWNTAMLAAHLALRDRRPDAALGIAVPFLAGHTEKVQREYAAKPWPELLDLLREGPPRWSPVRWGPVAEAANLLEFFVHAEDVRRAQPEPQPYTPDPELAAALWGRLRPAARVLLRRVPGRVVLRTDTGEEVRTGSGGDEVIVTGAVGELVMHAFGREPADVTIEGSDQARAAYTAAARGI